MARHGIRRALVAAALLAALRAGAESDVAARPPAREVAPAPAHEAAPAPQREAAAPLAREDALPRGIPLADRLAEIQRRIQAAVVYPPLARRREVEGTSFVAFDISPVGEARHLELVQSSGSALLDRAAQRAVAAAAPLPPVLGRLRVPVRFQLEAPAPGSSPEGP